MYNILELGKVKNVKMENYEEFFNLPIYMILKMDYLVHIFKNEALYFSNVYNSWEDPYELFLLKHDIYVEGKSLNAHYLKAAKQMYGQSWSLLKDSDALWRIYSHDKMSVRIKTTFQKMMDVIDQTRGIMYCSPGFGKVEYKSIQEINIWINRLQEQGTGLFNMSFMDSIFIKREEFSHEQEIRFVLWKLDEYEPKDGICLHVNPFDLIEEIALDPRLDEEQFPSQKQIIDTIISNRIPIIKSELYNFDRLMIDLNYTPIRLNYTNENKEKLD